MSQRRLHVRALLRDLDRAADHAAEAGAPMPRLEFSATTRQRLIADWLGFSEYSADMLRSRTGKMAGFDYALVEATPADTIVAVHADGERIEIRLQDAPEADQTSRAMLAGLPPALR